MHEDARGSSRSTMGQPGQVTAPGWANRAQESWAAMIRIPGSHDPGGAPLQEDCPPLPQWRNGPAMESIEGGDRSWPDHARQVQASAPALTLQRRHERCAKCGAPVGGGAGTIAAAIPLPPTTAHRPTHAAGTEARLGPAQELRPAKGFRSLAIALLTCVHDPFGLRVAQTGMGR